VDQQPKFRLHVTLLGMQISDSCCSDKYCHGKFFSFCSGFTCSRKVFSYRLC